MSRTGRPRLFPRDPKGGCLTPKCIGDHYRRGYCMTCYFRVRRAGGLSLPGVRRFIPDEMTPRELEEIGMLLSLTDDWYGPVAYWLGISPATVRRWHRGWSVVSFRAAIELRALGRTRRRRA